MTPMNEYAHEVFPDLLSDGSNGFVARHPDLPGCEGVGARPDDALRELKLSRESYLAGSQAANMSVPPRSTKSSLELI